MRGDATKKSQSMVQLILHPSNVDSLPSQISVVFNNFWTTFGDRGIDW
jgi:hypothetical protein